MAITLCIECDREINVEPRRVGLHVVCDFCGAEMEVVSTDPLELDLAQHTPILGGGIEDINEIGGDPLDGDEIDHEELDNTELNDDELDDDELDDDVLIIADDSDDFDDFDDLDDEDDFDDELDDFDYDEEDDDFDDDFDEFGDDDYAHNRW